MRMPFESLMEYAASFSAEEAEMSLGELARRVGEAPERLADAITAVRVVRGERTTVSPVDIRAQLHPAVRKALDADRGGVASGGLGSFFSD